MGVMWHFIVGPPGGEPTPPSGPGEDPDEAVRPELPPEQRPGPVRPKMARRCADDLTPPEAGTRTAASPPRRQHLREFLAQRLTRSDMDASSW
ncbi:hypothetical protein [Actinomadura sp. HBU206391]|uniref:hypothetical protein n=1 Tax=Actinomadura sp. HBU206391 TaxID=2731692 RepID=UPI00164F20E1|nr:hypothetical protein [Actinomadura sp. HBU206391]MBC6456601.1 hypothetical protein [Actinomadura sp. HBU206391]